MAEPLWRVQQQDRTDKFGYDEYYLRSRSDAWSKLENIQQHLDCFSRDLRPYYLSGNTKGYVRGLATETLLSRARSLGRPLERIRVLDAGCGEGLLSVYLAGIGCEVVGVDISESAINLARQGAHKLGVGGRCLFLAESLESMSIDSASIDFIIGHASLHHFIKYSGVPAEFKRVMKPGAEGFFADSFSENILYHLFQNRERMHQLGDVRLTKTLIDEYFSGLFPLLVPTDWFVMVDKFLIKVLPRAMHPAVLSLSRINFALDRRIPSSLRASLWMAGAVLTKIRKPDQTFNGRP